MDRGVARLRRFHALVRRLYPGRRRKRESRELTALLERVLDEAENDAVRRHLLRRAIRDAIKTLPRAWTAEVKRVLNRRRKREGWMGTLRNDIGFTLRSMRRRPLYTVVAVVTLGIALGANAAIYSLAEATVFRTLPYESPDRVVRVEGSTRYVLEPTDRGWTVSRDFREMPGIEAAGVYIEGGGVNLVAQSAASRLTLTHVSEDFFEVLGVDLAFGGGFRAGSGDPNSVVISHRVWTDVFGSARDIVGRSIDLGGTGFVVVGVAPGGVSFPGETDLWIPQPLRLEFLTGAVGPDFMARLESDADRAETEALLRERTGGDERTPPPGFQGPPPPSLVLIRDALVDEVRTPLRILTLASALLLLLGSLNLAGVTVSQLMQRDEELRVRVALGASRSRLFRQLFVETLVLGGLGGALAILLASGGVRALVAGLPGGVEGLEDASISLTTLGLVAVLTVLASLAIGALPSYQAVRSDTALTRSGTGTRTRGQVRLQAVMIVGQVTLALVLVTAAGLLSRSLGNLLAVPIGIDTRSVITAEIQLSPQLYGDHDQREGYFERALDGLASLPGVTAAGAVTQLPLNDRMGIGFGIKRVDEPEDASRYATWLRASSGYFRAVGTRVLAGRSFGEDSAELEEVILSQVAAESLGLGLGVIDRTIHLKRGRDEWQPVTVVGVVENVRRRGPESLPDEVIYEPLTGGPSGVGFAIGTAGDPTVLTTAVDALLREIDPATPPFAIRTTRQALTRELADRRSLAIVSSLFGLLAMFLAGVGLYGLVAQSVTRRRREIGIRIALGADRRRMSRLVLGQGLLMALAGVLLGLPIALQSATVFEDTLFQMSERDPWIIAGAASFLVVVALWASWIPSRRAGRVDPIEVLASD